MEKDLRVESRLSGERATPPLGGLLRWAGGRVIGVPPKGSVSVRGERERETGITVIGSELNRG